MGQKDGEKWTAAVDSQPTLPKPDRLLAPLSPSPAARRWCSGLLGGIFSGLVLLLAACATPPPPPPPISDRIILLPQAGAVSSALEVSAGAASLRLDRPYAVAQLRGGALEAGQTTAEEVQANYGTLLSLVPARPRQFTLQFQPNGSQLAPGADAIILQIRQALALLPAAELIITGHTDRVGTVEANDRLSLQRAAAVRESLASAGLDRASIGVVGRGEREPLIATADEVAEPRNRRVEIKIR